MKQLRSLEDHQPLPGIEVGDLGSKLGYQGVDNGYLRMNHVHVGQAGMLYWTLACTRPQLCMFLRM